MVEVDTLIVGGGPAGSSCAWRLRRHGIECLLLDRSEFPRLKLCAGWVTPEVLGDLEIEPGEYPFSFLTFESLRFGWGTLGVSLKTRQHSIRRIEFDTWLLQRSGVEVVTHNVREIRRDGAWFVVDGQWRCRRLVGAGGTRCPVHRALFREIAPRKAGKQAVVLEEEFPYDWDDATCRLWFFEHGLPGYSWYVPKAGGHLNVGVGAIAQDLKARGDAIGPHWSRLTAKLARQGLVRERRWDEGGYTYYLRNKRDVVEREGAFLVGDAAGLATTDLAEGIGPAVRSGLAVADAIAGQRPATFAHVSRRSLPAMLREHGGLPSFLPRLLGWN
jgi:flavin-dependent dehydrogenase